MIFRASTLSPNIIISDNEYIASEEIDMAEQNINNMQGKTVFLIQMLRSEIRTYYTVPITRWHHIRCHQLRTSPFTHPLQTCHKPSCRITQLCFLSIFTDLSLNL